MIKIFNYRNKNPYRRALEDALREGGRGEIGLKAAGEVAGQGRKVNGAGDGERFVDTDFALVGGNILVDIETCLLSKFSVSLFTNSPLFLVYTHKQFSKS